MYKKKLRTLQKINSIAMKGYNLHSKSMKRQG